MTPSRSLALRVVSLVVAFVAGALFVHLTEGPAGAPGWTTVASLERPRAFARAVALATGELLVVGGLDPDDPQVTSTSSEIFDPRTGRVATLPDRLLGRLNQTVTVGWGDRVVVVGGTEWRGDGWAPVDRVDVFMPFSHRWIGAQPLKQARSSHGATALLDGRVLVTGGNSGARLLRTTEIYDPTRDRWTLAASLPRPRTDFSIATLPDGRVLVAGGIEDRAGRSATSLLYDPVDDSWSEGPPLDVGRINHATVPLPNGDVLLIGGDGPGAGTAELYVAREGRFVYAGALAEPRVVPQAALLPDGRVLVSGGLPDIYVRTAFTPVHGAELWDAATRRWSDAPSAPSGRAYAVNVAVSGGLIRVSGSGDDERAYDSIEWYRAR